MAMISGAVKERRTVEQVRAGVTIAIVPFIHDEGVGHYIVKAVGEIVDVNPGQLMQFSGKIWIGKLSPQDCTVRYMPERGTAIVQIE